MLKNQGFIYITPCYLSAAPLIKLNFDSRPVLPAGFVENNGVLALWPINTSPLSSHQLLDQLHSCLIRAGLAFAIPKVYQSNLTSFVSFIDEWLEVERHLEGAACDLAHDFDAFPLNSHYAHESSINMLKLGHAWLSHEPAYELCASSAFYRGMVHGQTTCQVQMARCYEEGVGIEIDFTRAFELLNTIKNQTEVFPILLRLSYHQKNSRLIESVKNDFFMSSPLPLPGKGDLYGEFHHTLLEMLSVSYEQVGHLDFWLSCWELISPYREELLALSEVRVMDHLDTPEASQIRHFHDILSKTFLAYRQSA